MTSWGGTVTVEFARGMHPHFFVMEADLSKFRAESKHQEEMSTMNAAPYDILKKDTLGNPIWIEAVEDLQKATARIEELALHSPGEYIVFNQQTSQIVHCLGASQLLERESTFSAYSFRFSATTAMSAKNVRTPAGRDCSSPI
jgi:hypothetical protein